MSKFLDLTGLTTYDGLIKGYIGDQAEVYVGSEAPTSGDYKIWIDTDLPATEYATQSYVDNHHDSTKQDVISDLSTIRSGATAGSTAVQPATLNNYSTTTEMNTAIAAHHDSTKQDVLTAGSNIQINGSTISATDTTYSDATTSASGLMSSSDKTKLNSIASGATAVSVSASGTSTDEVSYITIDGVEKKLAGGGGSGEPAAYIKDASVSDKTLTLTKKDNTTVTFTDTGSIVTGTDDGTNWTSLTVDGTTKSIPSGGGASYTAGQGINITDNVIGISVGGGLEVNQFNNKLKIKPGSSGTISSTPEDGINATTATANQLGVVKPDGTSITIDANGVISSTRSYVLSGTTLDIYF